MNPSFLIDIGGTSYFPDEPKTGIPRVTLSLTREMCRMGGYRDMALDAMSLLHKDFKVPPDILSKFDLVDNGLDLSASNGFIFLLDIYYFKFNFLNKLPDTVRRNFSVIDYIHDILPLRMDESFDTSGFKFKYMVWQSLLFSDAIMTPTKFTADDIVDYVVSNDEVKIGDGLKLGYCHHGADIANRQLIKDTGCPALLAERPYFLMVGTVEVRKNHLFVLEAFEKLWEQGYDFTLCIAGKVGWRVEAFARKYKNHPERDRRLIFINTPTDEELVQIYRHAYCLIFASRGEGFGLPLVEAASYQVPLLISDIPVFHEVAGKHARYFSLQDNQHLVQALRDFIEDDLAGRRKEDSANIKQITWSESAKTLLDCIIDDAWYCRIDSDKCVEYRGQDLESDNL